MCSNTSTRPTASLVAPSWALSSCVRGMVFRSTLGADLKPMERVNHFPASPLCGISWLFEGEAELLPTGEAEFSPRRLPQVSFFGPHGQPSATRNPGPASGMMLMLLPDALHAMTGVDIAAQLDRTAPLAEVLDADWCAMAEAVLCAPDNAARVRTIEAFLAPRWQAARRLGAVPVRGFEDWAQALAVRTMASGMGSSLRQAERRVRAWTGQSLRTLRVRARAESAFFQARDAMAAGGVDWAALAAESGYADQAHFCREARRVTGLSPGELRRRMDEDESFWIYRIWR